MNTPIILHEVRPEGDVIKSWSASCVIDKYVYVLRFDLVSHDYMVPEFFAEQGIGGRGTRAVLIKFDNIVNEINGTQYARIYKNNKNSLPLTATCVRSLLYFILTGIECFLEIHSDYPIIGLQNDVGLARWYEILIKLKSRYLAGRLKSSLIIMTKSAYYDHKVLIIRRRPSWA